MLYFVYKHCSYIPNVTLADTQLISLHIILIAQIISNYTTTQG